VGGSDDGCFERHDSRRGLPIAQAQKLILDGGETTQWAPDGPARRRAEVVDDRNAQPELSEAHHELPAVGFDGRRPCLASGVHHCRILVTLVDHRRQRDSSTRRSKRERSLGFLMGSVESIGAVRGRPPGQHHRRLWLFALGWKRSGGALAQLGGGLARPALECAMKGAGLGVAEQVGDLSYGNRRITEIA